MSNVSNAGQALTALEGFAAQSARLAIGRVAIQGAVAWEVEEGVGIKRQSAKDNVQDCREEVLAIIRDLEAKNLELSEELAHILDGRVVVGSIRAHNIGDGDVAPKRRGVKIAVRDLRQGDRIDIYAKGDVRGEWEPDYRNVESMGGAGESRNLGNPGGMVDGGYHDVYLVERPNATAEDMKNAPVGTVSPSSEDFYELFKMDEHNWQFAQEGMRTCGGLRHPAPKSGHQRRKLVYP